MLKSVIAAALFCAASAATAATYDVVSTFGAAGSPFTFGSGTGAGFAASPNFDASGCLGDAVLACYDNHANAYTFPAVAKNTSAATTTFFTNVLPTNLLFVQSLPGTVGTVRFTAPTTSTYSVTSSFTRIDNSDGSGDGVTVGAIAGALSTSQYIPTVYQSSVSFDGPVFLTAGSTIDFYIDALGNTYYDGTGFAASITAVPEPATWGLMLAGFAMTGVAARRKVARTA